MTDACPYILRLTGLVYICHGRRAINSSTIFRTILGDRIGGYGLRRMCLLYIRVSCDFCTDSGGTDRDKSVRRLRGDCTEVVEFQCGHRAVSASFLWKSYGARAASMQRLDGDTVTPVLMLRNSESRLFTISRNMGGSLLRYYLKSKCPRATSCLSSHGFIHSVFSLRLCRTCCSSRTARTAIIACSLLLTCLNCTA